ncbi:MAG: hypothetical protein JNM40_01090 [Myxococcales bacterium]|nr:hypothetical protein [Myxococcales bacterium]
MRISSLCGGVLMASMAGLLYVACYSQGGYSADMGTDLQTSQPDLATSGAKDAATDQAAPDLGCPARTIPSKGGCAPCSILVPDEQPTISQAIGAAPNFGTVCILPGTYKESITLRPHVSLQGVGPTSKIVGNVSVRLLSDADPTPTALRDLSIFYTPLAALTNCPADMPGCTSGGIDNTGRTIALVVERVLLSGDTVSGTTQCAQIEAFGGTVNVTFRDSICRGERGLRLRHDPSSSGVHKTSYLIERNRFEPSQEPSSWTYNGLDLLFPTSTGTLPAGSKVRADVRNNEFVRTRYEGIYVTAGLLLQSADQADAKAVIANNTFVSDDGKNAIWDNSRTGTFPQVVSVNNLFVGSSMPHLGRSPSYEGNNLTGTAASFVNLSGEDLHLAPGASAIDAADPVWAPSEDRDQRLRPIDGKGGGKALPDVGAFEYAPGGR